MEANIAVLCKGDIKYLVTVLIQQEKRKKKTKQMPHIWMDLGCHKSCPQLVLYISPGPGADN